MHRFLLVIMSILSVSIFIHEVHAEFTITTSKNVLRPLEPLYMSWSVTPNEMKNSDWIGLFPLSAPDEANHPLWFIYTQGLASGTRSLHMPSVEGNYEFRYFSGAGQHALKARSTAILGVNCAPHNSTRSNVKHLVLIVQENHSFDGIFGQYCHAEPGSNPTCTRGPNCCEAGPAYDPGSGFPYFIQTDSRNARYDPNHNQSCELSEMNEGKMDHYMFFGKCGNWIENFAYADAWTVSQYWQYAATYALADRYFQPIAGASSSNDMYFARAGYVFTDNQYTPANAVGSGCAKIELGTQKDFTDPNIGDMLMACQVPFHVYAGGYADMQNAGGGCPPRPEACHGALGQILGIFPCSYDPSDVPFQFYPHLKDQASIMKDLDRDFHASIEQGTLPAVSYIKTLGLYSEHPGEGVTLSDGVKAVSQIVKQVLESPLYGSNTLILVTYDESGGYFDHIAPPPNNIADHQPYGPRVPLMAIGYFAKNNFISHVTMEHSSIVKFIEWNWFAGNPDQLQTRDAVVNNIGSLLDPQKTGAPVPNF